MGIEGGPLEGQAPGIGRGHSRALKLSLFAAGCAGLVAEFVLSTLASYLLGNSVVQWTLTISLMLFSMGLGSRLSRHFEGDLLDRFIAIELLLSLLCASCAMACYALAAFIPNQTDLLIYSFCLAIGLMIGLEIPLATRINQSYECLRVNISSVMENDYYGALAGGIAFAFFAFPRLGLTYTPVALGGINLLVALLLYWRFRPLLHRPRSLGMVLSLGSVLLLSLGLFAQPILLFGEQSRYRDKIVFEKQTPYQRIVVTQWRDQFWLFINGSEQFSSLDEERYHEPLVHPALSLAPSRKEVLILGGGDGLAAREVLKYQDVHRITLVDLDPEMTRLASEHPLFLKLNQGSLRDPRVRVINQDAYRFLEELSPQGAATPGSLGQGALRGDGALEDRGLYDLILIDLPDPDAPELAKLYSREFFELGRHRLKGRGVLVTQATSPFHAPKAFVCIAKTMEEAGFSVLPYHTQVPTLGEWGWVLGMKREVILPDALKKAAQQLRFAGIPTRFLNQEAMISMVHFGKGVFEWWDRIQPNTAPNPVLIQYYQEGWWELN